MLNELFRNAFVSAFISVFYNLDEVKKSHRSAELIGVATCELLTAEFSESLEYCARLAYDIAKKKNAFDYNDIADAVQTGIAKGCDLYWKFNNALTDSCAILYFLDDSKVTANAFLDDLFYDFITEYEIALKS